MNKRKLKREEAEEERKKAEETGDQEALARFAKRTVRVTTKHNDECKRLLRLMGVPVIEVKQNFHFFKNFPFLPFIFPSGSWRS